MTEEKKEFGKAPELYDREIDWRRALDKTYGVDFKENDNLRKDYRMVIMWRMEEENDVECYRKRTH